MFIKIREWYTKGKYLILGAILGLLYTLFLLLGPEMIPKLSKFEGIFKFIPLISMLPVIGIRIHLISYERINLEKIMSGIIFGILGGIIASLLIYPI